jgi:hypothetical protein
MAPKSSQRSSLGSSQPQPFQAAVTQLCKTIDEAQSQAGEIKCVKWLSISPSHTNIAQSRENCQQTQSILKRISKSRKGTQFGDDHAISSKPRE